MVLGVGAGLLSDIYSVVSRFFRISAAVQEVLNSFSDTLKVTLWVSGTTLSFFVDK